jgi:glycosyltransferase involved in cell wall biosynthesis
MKILHLFADWKWTGPAEPVLNLCLALRDRRHEVWLDCPAAPPEASTSLPAQARARGMEPLTGLYLRPGFHPFEIRSDRFELAEWLDAHEPDVVHVHQSHDHLVAALAVRRAKRAPKLVRTNHKGAPLAPGCGNRWLMSRTDGLLGFSARAMAEDAQAFGLAPGRTRVLPAAVDLERFDPARGDGAAGRAALGLQPGEITIGVVARIQRHRKWRELLEGFALARRSDPRLRLVVVGRGTHREEAAVRPARELGLGDAVVFAGYRGGDYLDVLAAFDMKAFLVPGSDGTCRAVREAMAMGKPVVAARTGMLPEIVEHGKTGLLVEPAPGDLALAFRRLAADAALRERMGKAGREKAAAEFRLEKQAEAVEAAYRDVAGAEAKAE